MSQVIYGFYLSHKGKDDRINEIILLGGAKQAMTLFSGYFSPIAYIDRLAVRIVSLLINNNDNNNTNNDDDNDDDEDSKYKFVERLLLPQRVSLRRTSEAAL